MSMEANNGLFNPRLIVQLLLFVVVIPFLPLLITGRWGWWQAWGFAVIHTGGFIVSRYLASRKYPDLLEERARMLDHEDAKSWDKTLAPLVALGGGAIPLVAGLDARFGWTAPFGIGVNGIALVLLFAGNLLGLYALLENRYFSGVVRIQKERNHSVVTTGPYNWIRHPGYAGAIIVYLASPFLLNSLWALLPASALIVLLILRTALEDQTLQAELPGYDAYASQTRYRLLPQVW